MLENNSISIYSIRKNNLIFLFKVISPSFILASIVVYYPVINSIIMSFKKARLGKEEYNWVGLKNFLSILKSGDFFQSFSWTLVFGAISTLLFLIIGMYFAILLNRKMIGRNLIRGLLLLPWAIPVFVNGLLWLWLLDIQFGLINYILRSLNFIKANINWFGGTSIARISVIIAYVWKYFPFNMVVYLAGFQAIDPVYYEAAEIDGASKIKQFLYITLPQIKNIIIFTLLLNFIWSFQEFTTIWIMTKGGPAGATSTMLVKIFIITFQENNLGVAAANGTLWLVFVIIFSVFYLRFFVFKKENII